MGISVGSISVHMGADLTDFQSGIQKATDLARSGVTTMSAEMKRTSREGAESFRLIDEAIGLHLSRPITRILTQEFPSLAKGLQSILGAGVVGAIGVAGFELLSKAVEHVSKAIEDAKKKQEAFQQSVRDVNDTLAEAALSHEQRMAQMNSELAALSGDKAGALSGQLKVISIQDAESAIRQLDAITDKIKKEAEAAAIAQEWTTRMWLAIGRGNSSEFTLEADRLKKQSEAFKDQLHESERFDALHGTSTSAELIKDALAKANQSLTEMQGKRIGAFDSVLADIAKAFTFVPFGRGLFNDKAINEQKGFVDALKAAAKEQADADAEHAKHVQLATRQSAATPDIGQKELSKLQAETEAQLQLAAAARESVAAQKLQLASGQADELISRILEEAHGKLTTAVLKEIAAVHALTAERQVAKDSVALNQELQKETEAYRQQIESLIGLAAAYAQGGSAIPEALISKQLEADKQKVAELTEEYSRLEAQAAEYTTGKAKLGTAAGPVSGLQGVDPKALADLKIALDQANASLGEHKKQLEEIRSAGYDVEISKEANALRGEQPLLDALNAAYFENAQAVRQAQIALALYHWEQAHPDATSGQVAKEKDQLEQQSLDRQRQADTELAYRYAITKSYDDELAKLGRAKDVLQGWSESTLLVDARIYDERQQLLKQWDDAAFKVGHFSDQYQAVMNELVIQGEQAGSQIAKAFLSAIDQTESDLAKALTGQKVDGRKIVQNLAEQVTKADLQFGIGKLAGSLGINLPGKPDEKLNSAGSALSRAASELSAAAFKLGGGTGFPGTPPFFGSTGEASSGGTGLGGILGTLGGFFKRLGQKNSLPFTAGDLGAPTAIPGVVGATGSSFSLPEIAGFMGGGGDLTPGRNYIVGEHGTELLRIPLGGNIAPNSALRELSSRGGDVNHSTHITNNFQGIKDSDMFRRSVRQEHARMFRQFK